MSVVCVLLLVLCRIYEVRASFIRSWFGIYIYIYIWDRAISCYFNHDLSFAFRFIVVQFDRVSMARVS